MDTACVVIGAGLMAEAGLRGCSPPGEVVTLDEFSAVYCLHLLAAQHALLCTRCAVCMAVHVQDAGVHVLAYLQRTQGTRTVPNAPVDNIRDHTCVTANSQIHSQSAAQASDALSAPDITAA